MRISGRRNQRTGAIAVVGVLSGIGDSNPTVHHLAGFRFDSSQSGPSDQPWTSYANPSVAPSITNGYENMSDIAVSPENNKIVISGWGNGNKLQIYDFSVAKGFNVNSGSAVVTEYTGSATNELDHVTGIAFSADKTALAVTSERYVVVYDWSSGSINQRRWISSAISPSVATYSSVNFWPYDENTRSGPDEMVVATLRPANIGSGNLLGIYSFALNSSGTSVAPFNAHTIPTGPAAGAPTNGWGRPNSPANLSPLLIGGSRTALFDTNNDTQSPEARQYVNGMYQVSDGAAVSYPSGYVGTIDRISNIYISYSMFDYHGRAIVARTNSPDLEIYTQSKVDGDFTLLDSYSAGNTRDSSAFPAWGSRGIINSMFYDEDRDILFVCHRGSPYLTAIQMCDSGFDFKYNDMASPAPSSFVRASLVYDEKWKSYNS